MAGVQYKINIQADASAAQRQVEQLSASLQRLQSNSRLNLKIDTNMADAAQQAAKLQQALQQAVNVNTGQINFSALSNSLASANTNVQTLIASFQRAGTTGQQAISQLSSVLTQATIPAQKATGIIASFGTTLMNTVKWQAASQMVHGLQSAMSGAVSYIENLNTSLNNIRVVTGKSISDMSNFAKEANVMAKSLSTSTKAYADAALIYYQQGDNDRDVQKKAQITLKAANTAFKANAAEMSEMLTAVWNSYKAGGDQLEGYVDVMAKLGSTTATSMEEIATALQKVAATASTVGVGMEQMSSIVATVSSVTRESAESIGTSFKTILARMGDLKLGETLEDGVNLGKVSSSLNAIGVQVLDATGNMRDMGDVITDLGNKWQTMGSAQKTAIAQVVAGKRQYTQLMALFENWDTYQKDLQNAQNSAGSLEKMQKIYEDSVKASKQRVQAAKESIFGDLINDQAIVKFNNALTTALSAVRGIVNGLGGIPGILATVASAMMRAFKPQMLTGLTNGLVNLASTFGPSGRFAAMMGVGSKYQGQGLANFSTAYNQNRQNGMSVWGAMRSALPTYGGYNRYMAQQGLSQENQMAAMQRYASVKWNGNSSQRALFDNLTTVQQTGAQNAALYNQRAQEARANGNMALGFQHTLSSEAATAQQQSAFLKQDALLRQGQMTQQQAAALQQRIDFMNNRQATLTEHATNLQDIAGNAHRELSIGSLATLEGTRSVDQFRQQFFDAQNGDGAWDALSDSGRAIARGSVNRAIASMAQETQNEARSNTLKNNFSQLVSDAQNTGNFQKLSGILSKDNNPFANLVSDLVGKSAEDLEHVDWDSVLSRDTLQQTQDAFERMFATIGGDSAARAAEYGEQQAREETSAAIDIAAAEEAAAKFEESGEAKAQKLAQGLMAAAQGAMAITQGLTQAQGIMNAWNSGDGLTFATSMVSAGASLINTFATQGPIMGAIQATTMAATAIFTAMENAEKERTQRMVENAQKTNAILEEHQNKSKEILDAEKQKNNLAEQFEEGTLSAQEYSSALAEVASSLGIQGAAVMALTGNYEGLTAAIENSINASKSFALSQAQSDTRIAQNNLFNQAVNVMESNGLSGKYSKNGTSTINYWDILGNINTDLGNSNLINLLRTNPEFVNYLESQGVSLASREGRGGFNEDYIAALLGGTNAGGGSKRNDFLINTDKESLLGYYNQIEALRSATANSTDLYQKQQLEALTGSSSFQSFASLISEMVEPYLNALKMERELSGNSWLTSSNNTIYTEAGKWSLDVRQQLINALLQNWGIAETDTSAVAEAARSQAQSLVDAYAAGLEGVSATEITKTASAQSNKDSALKTIMARSGLSAHRAQQRMDTWGFTEDDWAILTDIDSFLDNNGNLSNSNKMPDLIRSRNRGLAASSVMSQWNSRFGENFDFESFGSTLPDMFSTLGITGYNSADWKTASSSEKASMVAAAMAQVENSYAEWSQSYVDSTTALQAVVDQATNSFLQKQFGKDLTQEQLEAKWMEQRQFQGFLEENLTADNNFNMDYDTLTTTLANAPFLKQFFASDYAIDSFGDRITDTDNYDFSNRMLRYIAHMSGMDLGDYDVGGDLFNSNTDNWIQNIDFSEVLGNLQSTEAEYNSLTKTLEAAKLFVATADGKEASLEWLNGADLDPTKWKDTELALNSLLLELGQGDHPTFEDWFGMSELDRTAYKLELMRKNLEDLKDMEGQEGYDADRVKQLEAQYGQANLDYQNARISEASGQLATLRAEYEKIAAAAQAAGDAIKNFSMDDLDLSNITAFKQALLEAGMSAEHVNEVIKELTNPETTDYDKMLIKAQEMGNLALEQLNTYYAEYQQLGEVGVQDTIIHILGYTSGGDVQDSPIASEYVTTLKTETSTASSNPVPEGFHPIGEGEGEDADFVAYVGLKESSSSEGPDTSGLHGKDDEVEESDYFLHWSWDKDEGTDPPVIEQKTAEGKPDITFTWTWQDMTNEDNELPSFVQDGAETAKSVLGQETIDKTFYWAYQQVTGDNDPPTIDPNDPNSQENLKKAATITAYAGWAWTKITDENNQEEFPQVNAEQAVEIAKQFGWQWVNKTTAGNELPDLKSGQTTEQQQEEVLQYYYWAYKYNEAKNAGAPPTDGQQLEGMSYALWYYQFTDAQGTTPTQENFSSVYGAMQATWYYKHDATGQTEDDPTGFLEAEWTDIAIKWHFEDDNNEAFKQLQDTIKKYLTENRGLEVDSEEYQQAYSHLLGYTLVNGLKPDDMNKLTTDMLTIWEKESMGFSIPVAFSLSTLTGSDVEAQLAAAREYTNNHPFTIKFKPLVDFLDDEGKLTLEGLQAAAKQLDYDDANSEAINNLKDSAEQLTIEAQQDDNTWYKKYQDAMKLTTERSQLYLDAAKELLGPDAPTEDIVEMADELLYYGEQLANHILYLSSDKSRAHLTNQKDILAFVQQELSSEAQGGRSYARESDHFNQVADTWFLKEYDPKDYPKLQAVLADMEKMAVQSINPNTRLNQYAPWDNLSELMSIDDMTEHAKELNEFRTQILDAQKLADETIFNPDWDRDFDKLGTDKKQQLTDYFSFLKSIGQDYAKAITEGLSEDNVLTPELEQEAMKPIENFLTLIGGEDWQTAIVDNPALMSIGRFIILGILEGMNVDISAGDISGQLDGIIGFKDSLLAQLCAIFGIHSPAETTKFIGKFLVEGILEGFSTASLKINAADLAPLEKTLMKALQSLATKINKEGKNLFDEVFKGMIDPSTIVDEAGKKRAEQKMSKNAIYRMFGIDEKTGQLREDVGLGTDDLYYKNYSEDVLSAINKAILSEVIPNAANNLQLELAQSEGGDVDGSKLLAAVETEIEISQKELVQKIQTTWSQLITSWQQILDAIVNKDAAAAQQVLETWINTFKAIAAAFQSILGGLSIADALTGDIDAATAMIEKLIAKYGDLAKVRDLWFSEDKEEVLPELNLNELSAKDQMAKLKDTSLFNKAMNWFVDSTGGAELLNTSYADYQNNLLSILRETADSDLAQTEFIGHVQQQIASQMNIVNSKESSEIEKTAALTVLKAMQDLGLLKSVDNEGKQIDLGSAEGRANAVLTDKELTEAFFDKSSGIYQNVTALQQMGMMVSEQEFAHQYADLVRKQFTASSDQAKALNDIAQIPLKEAVDNYNALTQGIEKLKPDQSGKVTGDLMSLDTATAQRLMKIFGLKEMTELLNLTEEQLTQARVTESANIATQKDLARQTDWLIKQGYDLQYDDQGNLIGGRYQRAYENPTEKGYGIVDMEAHTNLRETDQGYFEALVDNVWMPVMTGLQKITAEQVKNHEEDWVQDEATLDWINEKLGARLTNEQYQSLQSGSIESAVIQAGTLIVGTNENLTAGQLGEISEAGMPEDWKTGNEVIDDQTMTNTQTFLDTIKESASAIGMLNSELKDYINATSEANGGTMRWDDTNIEQNALLAQAAEEYWRAEQAVEALNAAWEEGGLFEKIEGGTAKASELQSAYETLAQAVNDFFRENEVGTEFVKDNYDLIKNWASGSEEAMEELEAKILTQQLQKMFEGTEKSIDDCADQLARLNKIANGLKFGEKLGGQAIKDLHKIQKELGLTNDQMLELMDTMGIQGKQNWGQRSLMTLNQFMDQFGGDVEAANAVLADMGLQIQQNAEGAYELSETMEGALDAVQAPEAATVEVTADTSAAEAAIESIPDGEVSVNMDTSGVESADMDEQTGQNQSSLTGTGTGFVQVGDGPPVPVTASVDFEASGETLFNLPNFGGTGTRPTGPSGGPNGGGGGGGGGGKKKKKGKSKADIPRYHEVDQGIKRYDAALSQVAKKEEMAFGFTKVRLMREELEKLTKEMELYQERLNEAAAYASKDRSNVEGLANQLGIALEFDEAGTIKNWEALQEAIVDWYNAHKDEEAEDGMEGPDDVYERMKKVIEDYEDSLEQLEEYQEKILEQQHKMSEKMADIVEAAHDWKIELADIELNVLEGQLNRVEEIFTNVGSRAGLMAEALFGSEGSGLNGFTFMKLNEEMSKLNELQQAFLNGQIDGATMAERSEEIIGNLNDDMSDIFDRGQDIQALFEDLWSNYDDELTTNTDLIDKNITALQTLQEISDLIGAHKAFAQTRANLTEQYNQTKALVDIYKDVYNTIAEQKELFDQKIINAGGLHNLDEQQQKDYMSLLARLQDTQNSYYENLTSMADLARQRWEADVEEMGTELDRALAMGETTLDYLQGKYDRDIEVQDRYLNTAHQLYNINKLNRQIEQAMADTVDKALKNQYEELQNVINQKAKSGQLTQYDVDMMQKQYELLEKQAALRDAQNAKDTVRLTRDENGNYMYQYTADQEKVDEATQEYNDVLIEINELSLDRVRELEEQMLEKRKWYVEQAKAIALDDLLNEEEKAAKLRELHEMAQQDDKYFVDQMKEAYANLTTNNEACMEAYSDAYYSAFKDPTEGINPTIQAAIELQDSMATSLAEQIDWLLPKLKEFSDALDTSLYRTGLADMTNFDEMIGSTTALAVSEVGILNEELVNEAAQVDAVTDAWYRQKQVISDIFATIEAANTKNLELLWQIGGTEGDIATPNATGFIQYRLVPVQNNMVGYTDGTVAGSNSTTVSSAKSKKVSSDWQSKIEAAKAAAMRYNSKLSGYASGGLVDYTGPAWVDGTPNKPELMLNAADTPNLLNTIDMLHSIDTSAVQNLLGFIGGLAAAMSSSGVSASGASIFSGLGGLEQNVHISAEFPNATDRNEIIAAFDELNNRASQYINNYR